MSSICLICFHLLAQNPNLEQFSIYSNKFFHNFHLSESSFTCTGLRASVLARRLCEIKLRPLSCWKKMNSRCLTDGRYQVILLHFRSSLLFWFTNIFTNASFGLILWCLMPLSTIFQLYSNLVKAGKQMMTFFCDDDQGTFLIWWIFTQVSSALSLHTLLIRVITKLPNSEQSYKGKVKTHNYINRQNQSTTGKLWKP